MLALFSTDFVYADNANPPGLGGSVADDKAESDLTNTCPVAVSARLYTIHIIYPDPAVTSSGGSLTFSLKAGAKVCSAVNRYGVHQKIMTLAPATAAQWPGCDNAATISALTLPTDFDPSGQTIRGASGRDYSDVRSVAGVKATGLKTGCNGFRYTYCAYSQTSLGGSVSSSCAGVGYFAITYNPPADPIPLISCTVADIVVASGSSATVLAVAKHSGPPGALNVSISGTISITAQPDDSISGSLNNGTSTNVFGSPKTYGRPGTYAVTVRGTATGGGYSVGFSCGGQVTVIPPAPSATCAILMFSTDLEPGDIYTPQMQIVHTGALYSPVISETATVNVNGNTRSQAGVVVAQGSSTTVTFALVPMPATGLFTVTGSIAGTVSVGCSPITVKVIAKPYLKVYGSDVSAGGGLCSGPVDITATIKTFDRPNGAGRSGSSAEYAAFAYAAITSNGFYTKSASSSVTGDDLTFANNIASPGGNYGAQSTCEEDYYNTAKPTIITTATSTGSALCGGLAVGGTGTSAQYDINTTTGKFQLNNSCAPISGKVSIFVNGDVLVRDNINYSTIGQSSPDKLPSFVLVATGNIYISSSVTQLSGMYIAQRRTIYTCSNGFAAPEIASTDPRSVFTVCNNQLTVHGAFMAKNIRFLRAQNTLKQSSTDTNPNKAVAASYSTSTKAAEVFVTGPELYLSQPALKPRQSVSSSTFDGIASLAPIF